MKRPNLHFILQHYGKGKTELEAQVWYLTAVRQFPLYGCTLFPIVHKGLWSHTGDALIAINMDGIKFIKARDKNVINQFNYTEIESITIDPNDNYVTLELKNTADVNCQQRCFMFETECKEDIGSLIASYSPNHASWLNPEYESLKKKVGSQKMYLLLICMYTQTCLYSHLASPVTCLKYKKEDVV